MKALTLTQPYASLVAILAKGIETRSWGTRYRGTLAIHAAKRFPPEARDLLGRDPFRSVLREAIADGRLTLVDGELPVGAIVAVARLVHVQRFGADAYGRVRLAARRGSLARYEHCFGGFNEGRYGFHLAEVRRLRTAVPCRGALGLWDVPAALEVALAEAGTETGRTGLRPRPSPDLPETTTAPEGAERTVEAD